MKNNAENTPAATKAAEPQAKTNNQKGLIAAVVIFAILALAGIGFGVYSFIDANNKATENADLQAKLDLIKSETGTDIVEVDQNDTTISVIEGGKVDNAIAQTIINPYLKNFNYLNNLLDYEFNEDAKVEVAYLNTNINGVESVNRDSSSPIIVYYYSLNTTYQYLFGSDTELAERDYIAGHSDTFFYKDGVFEVSPWYGGGAGLIDLSLVKEAYFNGDNLVIETYHDTIPFCSDEGEDYCYDIVADEDSRMDTDEAKQFIAKFGSKVPVYKMIFKKDSTLNSYRPEAHYVLKDIQK